MNVLETYIKSNERKRSNDQILLSHTSTLMRSIARLYCWISTHRLLFLMIILICIPVTIYILLLILSNTQAFIPIEFQQNRYHLLLIVAHPDDECLFFSPTLRVLQTQYHFQLSLVVFSRGNHVGLGEIRAMELLGSCRALHIPPERCISLDLPHIQDNPKVWWSEQKLIPIIEEYVNKWSIDVLVSFDDQGVSGHINHRAVSSAVRWLTHNQTRTKVKMSYQLKSVSLLRKYSSILDFYWIFISFLLRLLQSFLSYITPFDLISSPDASYMLLINTPDDYLASRNAFASHRTQYSWDRHIYLLASRYMFVNELQLINKHV